MIFCSWLALARRVIVGTSAVMLSSWLNLSRHDPQHNRCMNRSFRDESEDIAAETMLSQAIISHVLPYFSTLNAQDFACRMLSIRRNTALSGLIGSGSARTLSAASHSGKVPEDRTGF